MSEISELFLGRWSCASGIALRIQSVPILGMVVIRKLPSTRFPKIYFCTIECGELRIFLSWLGHLESILILRIASSIDDRKLMLLPELEYGPESDILELNVGYSWLNGIGRLTK